jgi:hypothetical protein
MLVEHLVHRTIVTGRFDCSFATGVLFGEFTESVVWQANLVLQVAVAVDDGNLRVSRVGIYSEVHVTPPLGLWREREILLCVL